MAHMNHDRVKKSKKTAMQDLDEYLNDQSNHHYQFVDNVTRRAKAMHNECKQLSAKLKHLEKENLAIQKRLKVSEKMHNPQERKHFRRDSEQFYQEVKYNASSDVEKQLRLELQKLQKLNEQKDKEWERTLKESEETSNKMLRDQKRKIEQLQKDIKQSNLEVKDLMEEREFTFRDIGKLRKQLDDSEKQLKETEKELDETKTSFSKLMRDKLLVTDNNPNIADLSDKYRPTKLAEQYAEIYDNEWTDAFEKLETLYMEEKDIIKALLQILQDVMQFCKSKADRQMDDLQMVLSCSSSKVDRSIPGNIIEQLKDCRKALANVSKENLFQQFLKSDVGKRKDIAQVKAFVEVCIDICWLMTIQDPPVVIGSVSGDLFDTDVYKHYTHSGRYIEYVVWPVLLLHEGGPVLAKGVAQGCGEKLNMREGTLVNDERYPEITSRVEVGQTVVYGHGRSGITNHRNDDASELTYLENNMSTFENVGSGIDRHQRTRSAEETLLYQSATGRDSTNLNSPNTSRRSLEEDPTEDEMKIFFHYYARRDFLKARDALGIKTYERCWQTAYKKYKI